MTLRMIVFIECQLDENWAFFSGDLKTSTVNVRLNSWLQNKRGNDSRIICALKDGGKMGITVNANFATSIKFKAGSVAGIEGNMLVYDTDDIWQGNSV
jgi:hypothetical protein